MWRRAAIPLLALLPLAVVDDARAQRGRQSEFIRERSGTWVVDTRLPAPAADESGQAGKAGKIDLANNELVKAAAAKSHPAFLFVYDSTQDPAKHESFEQIIFGHAAVSLHLKPFVVGRLDIAGDAAAKARLGRRTPMFAAFDDRGKLAGQVTMKGYRASATPIVKLLERAAHKNAKLALSEFARLYSRFLNGYKVYEGRKRTLDQRRTRLLQKDKPPQNKLEALDAEAAELEQNRVDLLATEKELLEKAEVPARHSRAVQRGVRERARR